MTRDIDRANVWIIRPILLELVRIFVGQNTDVFFFVDFDAIFELNHLVDMSDKIGGKIFAFLQDEVCVVIFQVGRDAVRIFRAIRTKASDNRLETRISYAVADSILIIGA